MRRRILAMFPALLCSCILDGFLELVRPLLR